MGSRQPHPNETEFYSLQITVVRSDDRSFAHKLRARVILKPAESHRNSIKSAPLPSSLLQRRKLEGLKTEIDQIAVQVDPASYKLLVGVPEIGHKAFPKTRFQNANTSLHAEASF
jgi:hypothetical protein